MAERKTYDYAIVRRWFRSLSPVVPDGCPTSRYSGPGARVAHPSAAERCVDMTFTVKRYVAVPDRGSW